MGVITSPNYPFFMQNQNCQQKIIAASGKIIRIFLTDIKTETEYVLQINEWVLKE